MQQIPDSFRLPVAHASPACHARTTAPLAAYGGTPDAALTDIRHSENATEFWVPDFNIIAIIDLKGAP